MLNGSHDITRNKIPVSRSQPTVWIQTQHAVHERLQTKGRANIQETSGSAITVHTSFEPSQLSFRFDQ